MRGFALLLMAFAWAAVLVAAQPAHAQLPQPGRNAIESRLVAENNSPAAGETISLAIVMSPDDGWHGYWENPGDAGAGARVEWRLPEGVSAGPLRYPVPDRLLISGLMNYVYKGPYALLLELKVPNGMAPGTPLPIRGRLDYLACTDTICVPEQSELTLDLAVGAPGAEPERKAQFDQWRRALPKPLGSEAVYEVRDGRFRVGIPFPAAMEVSQAYLFPRTERAIAYAQPQSVSRNGDILIVETQAAEPFGTFDAVEGLLRIGEQDGLSLTARPGPVPPAGKPIASMTGSAAAPTMIVAALLGAIFGGLLLNVMPCVFPILSLKALSLAKAGGDEAAARREAIAYAGGAILTCLALGAALLALRSGGAAVGWAFQLQEPRVILLLLLLVTAIALNLAGLFELPSLSIAGAHGKQGAFWTGALAAFVATPCTGPFMGAALGAALVIPTPAALAVFGGLGLGLALPFVAIGFIPALRRRLPRPGPWMARFRRILAIPMALTALGLAWILARQTGSEGLAVGLAAAAILTLGLWLAGRRQGERRAWLPLAPASLAALAAVALVPTVTAPAAAQPSGSLGAEPFSEARLAALQAEGRPVFVYFTADWCVTCKVNEKGVLEREEVAEAFAGEQVAVLVGDWTRGDPAIGRFLASHGRSGVPLYLYYEPGAPVQVLPQILTTSRLTELAA